MRRVKPWILALSLGMGAFFLFLGRLYIEHYARLRPYGVILFVAPGLESSLLDAARQASLSQGRDLWMCRTFSSLALLSIWDPHGGPADLGALASSLASGQRALAGAIGLAPGGRRLDSLFYAAQRKGRATGLVTDGELTGPVLASFYSQTWAGPDPAGQIAAELLDTARPNVAFGGGGAHFAPANLRNEAGRMDRRNLVEEAKAWGYQVVHSASELEELPAWRTRWALGLFGSRSLYFASLREHTPQVPSLAAMVRRAVQLLEYDLRGYFLVVEEDLLGQAACHNWTELALRQVEELDAAVETATRYAGVRSLVIVVGLNGFGFLGRSSEARPGWPGNRVEWLYGPGGIPRDQAEEKWLQAQRRRNVFSTSPTDWFYPRPACFFEVRPGPAPGPGWVLAVGPGKEELQGFRQITDVYPILEKLF
jgi:hypothetical protein